jgi:ribosomal protein S18 acetylase RimI-like enzyme
MISSSAIIDKKRNKYSVRRLKITDSKLLWSFFQSLSAKSKQTFRPHPWTKHLASKICSKRFLESRGTKIVLQNNKKDILGYGVVNKIPLFPGAGYLGIGISDKYQGIGLGRGLLEYLLKFSKKDGFQEIWLNVFSKNKYASRLYERVGFTKHDPTIIMQKAISISELIFNEEFLNAFRDKITNNKIAKENTAVWMKKKA